MANPGQSSAAPQEGLPALELPTGSIHQLPQPSRQSPALSQESATRFAGWETIGEKRDFYDEQDCLHPSYNLASEKLQNRGDDDVVIFDYSLNPGYLSLVDGDPSAEGEDPPSGHFSEDDDIFSQVSKDTLIESKEFDQIINPKKEPLLILSRGPRLGIM